MKQALLKYLIMGISCLVIILPVTIRNYIVADDTVFIAWQGGYNFYIGNNRDADGYSASVPGIFPTWNSAYREQVVIAEKSMGRGLKKSEVSDFWYRLTWKEIKEDFGHFVNLLFSSFV
ncbi:MAG: hypothetical protein ACOYVF_03585 [Candidatus Zixiibacteriota bacterium]